MLRLKLRWQMTLLALMVPLWALPVRAPAATIALDSAAASVFVGDVVEIRIFGSDFADGTDGGDFALSWPSMLEFVDLVVVDPPWDLSSYDASGAATGEITFVDVFSFIDTPGIGGARFEIATLRLRALAPGSAEAVLAPSLVGWSLGGQAVDVAYGPGLSIEVLAIPEPRTASLLGLGLALLTRRRHP